MNTPMAVQHSDNVVPTASFTNPSPHHVSANGLSCPLVEGPRMLPSVAKGKHPNYASRPQVPTAPDGATSPSPQWQSLRNSRNILHGGQLLPRDLSPIVHSRMAQHDHLSSPDLYRGWVAPQPAPLGGMSFGISPTHLPLIMPLQRNQQELRAASPKRPELQPHPNSPLSLSNSRVIGGPPMRPRYISPTGAGPRNVPSPPPVKFPQRPAQSILGDGVALMPQSLHLQRPAAPFDTSSISGQNSANLLAQSSNGGRVEANHLEVSGGMYNARNTEPENLPQRNPPSTKLPPFPQRLPNIYSIPNNIASSRTNQPAVGKSLSPRQTPALVRVASPGRSVMPDGYQCAANPAPVNSNELSIQKCISAESNMRRNDPICAGHSLSQLNAKREGYLPHSFPLQLAPSPTHYRPILGRRIGHDQK
eukprot:Filipodium_phascolosomae@DN7146_c0_g1_i1.p1